MSGIDYALIESQRLAENEARKEILANITDFSRAKAFGKIDDERTYQDNKPENSIGIDSVTPVAAWIIYMRKHLRNAEEQVYQLNDKGAMAEVLKTTALGVAAMEYNETPGREVE